MLVIPPMDPDQRLKSASTVADTTTWKKECEKPCDENRISQSAVNSKAIIRKKQEDYKGSTGGGQGGGNTHQNLSR
jgi:hypothetical protein